MKPNLLNPSAGHSKIISFTRDCQAVSGNVSYTGVGFKPSSLHTHWAVSGVFQGVSFTDTLLASAAWVWSAANIGVAKFFQCGDDAAPTNGQTSIVASFDGDGFTLTWTLHGAGKANTPTIYVLCVR